MGKNHWKKWYIVNTKLLQNFAWFLSVTYKKTFSTIFQRILNQHNIQIFDTHIVFFVEKKIRIILVFFKS